MQSVVIPEMDEHNKLLNKSIAFIVEDENLDTIDFKSVMDDSYFPIITKLKESNIPLDVFVHAVLYEDEKLKNRL